MADIVLINPRFQTSFWGLERALPLLGKEAAFPPACLPLLAALTPPGHTVTLIDENVEPIDWDRCARADVVGVTGMSVQRHRMREVLAELKRRGCFTAVGGPWVTVEEGYFGPLADVVFVGEAEETWPEFLADWAAGRPAGRYEQEGRTDMTRVPAPRLDLLRMGRYAFAGLQFSRGCPFQCEFCDIIVTFGRRPRLKTPAQVVTELEAIRRAGIRVAFVVDDNLIGNKRAIKEVLRAVLAWQRANGYPLSLLTEASVDLADDPELMTLMAECCFVAVFVGIESPSEESLREAKKYQNVRPGGTLLEKVHRIQDAGLVVWCGMIVGFDSDDPGIFDRQVEFIRQARIPLSMTGMLHAIPKTPLHARLAREGRLDPADRPEFGTNVRPLRMSPEGLRDGYLRVLAELYDPGAFFERIEALFLRKSFRLGYGRSPAYWGRRPLRKLWVEAYALAASAGLFLRLMTRVPSAGLRREYRERLRRYLRVHRRPSMLLFYVIHMAMHYHVHTLAEEMNQHRAAAFNSF